jgi:hypothetical protein
MRAALESEVSDELDATVVQEIRYALAMSICSSTGSNVAR